MTQKFFENDSNFSYEKKVYTGDELEIDLNSDKNGWLTFVDNWDPNWQVYVNSKEKRIEKLFGAYKSVKIESGFSTVKFTYNPFNLNFTKNFISGNYDDEKLIKEFLSKVNVITYEFENIP